MDVAQHQRHSRFSPAVIPNMALKSHDAEMAPDSRKIGLCQLANLSFGTHISIIGVEEQFEIRVGMTILQGRSVLSPSRFFAKRRVI
jgi:hypothetical protein